MNEILKTKHPSVDVCVIGGGIGGMFTAISAARHGAKVVLMHDRPVLGGNACNPSTLSIFSPFRYHSSSGISAL